MFFPDMDFNQCFSCYGVGILCFLWWTAPIESIKCAPAECGIANGETTLICSDIAARPINRILSSWAYPPGTDLTILGRIKHGFNDAYKITYGRDIFNLTILETKAVHIDKHYQCVSGMGKSARSHACHIPEDKIEALECDAQVTGQQIDITISHRPYHTDPTVTLKNNDGAEVSGSFISNDTVHDLVKTRVWTSQSLPGGAYTYTVQKTGSCPLISDCTGTLTIRVPSKNVWIIFVAVAVPVAVVAFCVYFIFWYKKKTPEFREQSNNPTLEDSPDPLLQSHQVLNTHPDKIPQIL